MSRVGKRLIKIPEGIEYKNENNNIVVKGPKGQLERQFSSLIQFIVNDGNISLKPLEESKKAKQLFGTSNAVLSNMIAGVNKGFEKELLIKGVGYKAEKKGEELILSLGYSHKINMTIPKELDVEVVKGTIIKVSGIDKVLVGQFAANVKKLRKPNAYSGKGVSYKGEIIKLKEGKAAKK
ncbi:MAG: 50S ribosomal protein L6 [Mycoplasma sp.]|nr:50S ribosomal protein L6 [Mycoplasma sp.]